MRYRVHAVLFGIAVSVVTTAGCHSPPKQSLFRPNTPLPTAVAAMASGSAKVTPAAAVVPAGEPASGVVPAAVLPISTPAATGSLTIADLEQLALANNPTLVQAATFIDAARGKALQAGLPYNPTAGISAENIGVDRTAVEWTWFSLQQQIVTGGKLRLSRMKYEQEAELAEIQAQAQRLKVVNGLTAAYFDVLAAQLTVENERLLAKNAGEAMKTTEQLLNLGQANQQDLLQAQVEGSQARVAVRNAETRLRQDWPAGWSRTARRSSGPSLWHGFSKIAPNWRSRWLR